MGAGRRRGRGKGEEGEQGEEKRWRGEWEGEEE